MADFSVDELVSVCIARQVVDGEVLAQGINTPLVMAGFILAKCTHAPAVRFASAVGQSICQDWSPLGVGRIEDLWLGRALINVGFATAAAELLPRYNPKAILITSLLGAITAAPGCVCRGQAVYPMCRRRQITFTCMCRAIRALRLSKRWITSAGWATAPRGAQAAARAIWSAIWASLTGRTGECGW